jgi:outer membrane protein assembly factor BamA
VLVDSIEMTGFEVLSGTQQRTLRQSLPLQPGQPLDRQLAVATRDRALNLLKDEGYPYAAVGMQPQDVAPRRQRIVLTATPGAVAHIGVVDIRGEATVSENVIRRQLTFKPGDRFTRKELRESQRKLYGLELFEFANIESLEDKDVMAEEVPVRVTVAEAKHQKVTTGFGYGSEEKVRARLRWDHVNFLGGARHAGFEARWSSLSRGVRRPRHPPAPGQPAEFVEPVTDQRVSEEHHRRRGAPGFDDSQRPDCARPRSAGRGNARNGRRPGR